MKNRIFKNIIAAFVIVIITIICYGVVSASEARDNRINNTLKTIVYDYLYKFVDESYSEFYYIGDFQVEIFNSIKDDDIVIIETDVAFTKELKANSASELPYMIAIDNAKSSFSRSAKHLEVLNRIADFQEAEIESYIGVKQDATARFKLNFDSISLLIDDESLQVFYGLEYEPKESFYIDSAETMIDDITAILSKKTNDIVLAEEAEAPGSRVTLPTYHRLTARDYSNTYALSYNTNYTNQNPNGGDCANFVSQCIYAGGIPTDSTWKTYTIAWVNTGYSSSYYGLWKYMTGASGGSGVAHFSSVDKYSAAAGGFILWPYSHVGFINKNDTVSMTYNAHNVDCKDVSFAGSTYTTANGYKFFFSNKYAND